MNYTKEELDKIWQKAEKMDDSIEKIGFRKDMCGAWILKSKHGEESEYGWEVDHIYPKSKAEKDGISPELYENILNKQPLHHANNGNEGKGEDYPNFNSKIVSDDLINVEKRIKFSIPEDIQNTLKNLFNKNK